MSELKELINRIFENEIKKAVISKPASKQSEFKKITISRMPKFFQIAKHTEKQVFHENVQFDDVANRAAELMENDFLQFNAWDNAKEYYIIAKTANILTKQDAQIKKPPLLPFNTTVRSSTFSPRDRLLLLSLIWVSLQKMVRL